MIKIGNLIYPFPHGEEVFMSVLLELVTLFRMGVFGAAYGWGRQKAPLPKICHKILITMMKLGTDISYLKKIYKKYKLRDTPFEFC